MNGELYINGRLIDINEALPFPFTYNISDVKDLSTRKGNKSKTITLPGTANNCALMASVYLTTSREKIITSTQSQFLDFDPTVKSVCQYYENGLLVFNGIAQLLECKFNNGTWSFEISMVSNQIDYIALMKKIKINELDFTEYNHICDIASQAETWSGNNKINGVSTTIKSGANWLGIGYYYGLIDYGYTRVAADTFRVDQLAPQVFVYGILKKLFAAVGLTWQSTFFETQRFKRLLLAYFGGNLPDIDGNEAAFQSVSTDENNNAGGFIMQQTSTTSLVPDGFGNSYQIYSNPTTMVDIVDVSIFADPNTQTVTTTPFKFRSKTAGIFNINYQGSHDIKLTQSVGTQSFSSQYKGFLIVKKNNVVISTNQLYTNQTGFVNVYNQSIGFNFNQSINLLVNDELTFEVQFQYSLQNFPNSNNVINSVTSKVASSSVVLNIEKQVQTFNPGDTIRINQFLSDITGDVFFKGIITMFNLYLRPKNTDPTIIEIEPLNDFYNDSNAALDWSYLVDRSKEIKVTPTTNLAAKNYNFQFETEDDYYNSKYLNEYAEQYGSFLFDTQNQYATNNTDLKLPFPQKPLVVIPTTALIVPRAYQVNFSETATGQLVPMKGKSFIVQLGELRTGAWKHRSGANVNTNRSTYPYVGHLDSIDTPTFDLNFGVPDYVFYSAASYTTNNLYAYHETFIKEIVSRYGKLVTLSVMLNSSIINQLDFKNLILIDGVVYRLQKITDFDPGKEQATQIELIRILQGDSAAEPIPPPPVEEYRITEAGEFRQIEENTNLRIIE
jgi:hypothetical protein